MNTLLFRRFGRNFDRWPWWARTLFNFPRFFEWVRQRGNWFIATPLLCVSRWNDGFISDGNYFREHFTGWRIYLLGIPWVKEGAKRYVWTIGG